MKATELLQRQHRDIEALLERLHGAGQGDERTIRQELAATLVAHTVIEQESFYPAVQEILPEEINEAIEEHGLADVELARLLAAGPDDETLEAKVAVLSEIVINHIRREETEIFRAADRELTNEVLSELAESMGLRFQQILDTGYQDLLQKALDQELPRAARAARRAPARTAKKAARRAPASRKTTRKTARKAKAPRAAATAKRATPRRKTAKRASTPSKRVSAPRKQTKSPRKARKPVRRGAASTSARTRA
jgi:hemerythrin-like domain-containing protein